MRVVSGLRGQTWRLHHGLQILFLQLLNAFSFGHILLLQGAHLVHILIVEEFQVGRLMVKLSYVGLQLCEGEALCKT